MGKHRTKPRLVACFIWLPDKNSCVFEKRFVENDFKDSGSACEKRKFDQLTQCNVYLESSLQRNNQKGK